MESCGARAQDLVSDVHCIIEAMIGRGSAVRTRQTHWAARCSRPLLWQRSTWLTTVLTPSFVHAADVFFCACC
jgi:hypothetical protein